MTTVLPSQFTYGTVHVKIVSDVSDSGDVDDKPDQVLPNGTMTLTPDVPRVLFQTPDPADSFMWVPEPISVTITDGVGQVKAVATDNPIMNPMNWTYSVAFTLDHNLTVASFHINVPADEDLYLAMVAPIAGTEGDAISRGLPGPAGPAASLTVDSVTTVAYGQPAVVVIDGVAPDQTISFEIPAGQPGGGGYDGGVEF